MKKSSGHDGVNVKEDVQKKERGRRSWLALESYTIASRITKRELPAHTSVKANKA
jgi:hypothetical protein